jgi:calcineurin-like phosphoesterase family protein
MDFFTSDLHFGHKKMMVAEDLPFRPWDTMEAHDQGLIDAINSQASSMLDTVYIIGDLSFHKMAETQDILQRIVARKVLIKGNHDHRVRNKMGALLPGPLMVELDEFHHYLERKFPIAPACGHASEEEEQLICMFHFPMMHWHKQHKGAWQLHGHLHGTPSGVPGKVMDVGWDRWGKLLTLDDIDQHMSALPLRLNHHEGVGVQ